MKRICLTIAYDGTEYAGWQRQNGALAVQEVVENAIAKLTGTEAELLGASRTDAGVHALGNVAVFDTEATIPAERYAPALNTYLPDDIRIVSSKEVPAEFQPRFDAHHKLYEYHILTGEVCSPLQFRYVHFMKEKLDVEAMNRAAALLTGTHDYTSFCAAAAQVKTKVRTVRDITVTRTGEEIVISVDGDGFLYNMVRILAGTLVQVGLGRMKPEDMPGILEGMDRALAGPTLPAKGLQLVRIWFSE